MSLLLKEGPRRSGRTTWLCDFIIDRLEDQDEDRVILLCYTHSRCDMLKRLRNQLEINLYGNYPYDSWVCGRSRLYVIPFQKVVEQNCINTHGRALEIYVDNIDCCCDFDLDDVDNFLRYLLSERSKYRLLVCTSLRDFIVGHSVNGVSVVRLHVDV